jgi:hypothetical protein
MMLFTKCTLFWIHNPVLDSRLNKSLPVRSAYYCARVDFTWLWLRRQEEGCSINGSPFLLLTQLMAPTLSLSPRTGYHLHSF